MGRTSLPPQKEMLRPAVVTGDASDSDSIWEAVHDALPFVGGGRFKRVTGDTAFALNFGVVTEMRREILVID